MEGDYEQGDVAFYHEDADVFKVEVLENNSDSDWLKYRLKVLSVEQNLSICNPLEIGEEFSVCIKRKNVSCGGLWHLTNDFFTTLS
ncbi:hypothetical protein HYV49_06325 [Candidatus Pacearchaeota archaeon]|nr:hypothetical protein [Candidatus Pacearchaeota archaeon]